MSKALYIANSRELQKQYISKNESGFSSGILDLQSLQMIQPELFNHIRCTDSDAQGSKALNASIFSLGYCYIYITDTKEFEACYANDALFSSLCSTFDRYPNLLEKIDAREVAPFLDEIRAQEDFSDVRDDDDDAIASFNQAETSPAQQFRIALIDFARKSSPTTASKTIQEALSKADI